MFVAKYLRKGFVNLFLENFQKNITEFSRKRIRRNLIWRTILVM